jgi:hypothetical protein
MKAKPKRELKRRESSVIVTSKPPARIPYVKIAVLLLLLFGLMALAKCALADGDDHDHHGHHNHQTAVTNVYEGQNVIEGVVLVALLICPVRSVYTRLTEKRWTWCGEDKEKELPPNPGPAVKEEYNSLPDLKVYQ